MYDYSHPDIIQPRRFSIYFADGDDSGAFVVLEARDEAEALQRALQVSKEIGVSQNDSGFWVAVECADKVVPFCPQYRDEYFDLLDSKRARKNGQLH